MDIEKIIEDLRAQGVEDDKIVESLKQMAAEGKISEEDLQKAMALLQGEAEKPAPEADEKEEAGKLLGVNL